MASILSPHVCLTNAVPIYSYKNDYKGKKQKSIFFVFISREAAWSREGVDCCCCLVRRLLLNYSVWALF